MSVAGFTLRLVTFLAVLAATAGLYAIWEATPAGAAGVWLFGASVLAVPVLILMGDLVSNPVLDYLESRRWWAKAGSVVRIAAGVLATLPFVALLVASLAAFRGTLGAGQ